MCYLHAYCTTCLLFPHFPPLFFFFESGLPGFPLSKGMMYVLCLLCPLVWIMRSSWVQECHLNTAGQRCLQSWVYKTHVPSSKQCAYRQQILNSSYFRILTFFSQQSVAMGTIYKTYDVITYFLLEMLHIGLKLFILFLRYIIVWVLNASAYYIHNPYNYSPLLD